MTDRHYKSGKYLKNNEEYISIWQNIRKELSKKNAGDPETIRTLNKLFTEGNRIENEALKQYIEDTAGDYETLEKDAKYMIRQIHKEDIEYILHFAYNDLLKEKIQEELESQGEEITEEKIRQIATEKRNNPEEIDEQKLIERIQAEIRHLFLDEQYEAARYTFENQISLDGSTRKYPSRTKDEYIAFTCHISELAEEKINKIIKQAGGIYKLAFKHANTPLEQFTPVQAPTSFKMPNSYVSNQFLPFWQKQFYKENENGQLTFFPHIGSIDITGGNFKDMNKAVPVLVSLNYEGDITEDGKKTIDYNKARIDGFDLAVLDAICSFLETGQHDLYLSAIDGLLKGGKATSKMRHERTERLLLSLRKLSGTRIYLDVRNDLNTFLGEDIFKGGIYDGAMLSYEGLHLTTYAGAETYVFHVDKLPAIYAYSKAKREIVTFPAMLLDTGDRADIDMIPIKKELLRRITLLNKHQLHQTTISLRTIYNNVDLPYPTDRTIKSRKMRRFRGWLEYWKELNYIKDFNIKGDNINIAPNYEKAKE